VRRRKP